MCKSILIKLFLIILFFSTACKLTKPLKEQKGNHQKFNAIKQDSLFRLELFINKSKFQEDEEIIVSSKLKYIGKENKITIWHGEPYVNFTITGGNNFSIVGNTLTILKSTTLYKNRNYVFPYIKSGGYSETDSNAVLWKKFYAEKKLYLPKGEYVVKVFCDFSLSKDILTDKYSNQVETKFIVY